MKTDLAKLNENKTVTEPKSETLINSAQNSQLDLLEKRADDKLFLSVLKTSYKTLICMFLLILLSLTYFFMRFPYHTMKLYMEFSMHENALAHCQRAINRLDEEKYNDIYNECLLNGIELSNMLLIDSGNDKYAEKLIEISEIYAAIEDFDEVNGRLDEFYLQQIALRPSGISLYNALSLFSYKDFVYSRNSYARAHLGLSNLILFEGGLREIESLSAFDLASLSAFDLAVFFNQISYATSQKAYQLTNEIIDDFLQQAKNETDKIGQMYLLRAACNIADALKRDFADKQEEIEAVFVVDGATVHQYLSQKIEQF